MRKETKDNSMESAEIIFFLKTILVSRDFFIKVLKELEVESIKPIHKEDIYRPFGIEGFFEWLLEKGIRKYKEELKQAKKELEKEKKYEN